MREEKGHISRWREENLHLHSLPPQVHFNAENQISLTVSSHAQAYNTSTKQLKQ